MKSGETVLTKDLVDTLIAIGAPMAVTIKCHACWRKVDIRFAFAMDSRRLVVVEPASQCCPHCRRSFDDFRPELIQDSIADLIGG